MAFIVDCKYEIFLKSYDKMLVDTLKYLMGDRYIIKTLLYLFVDPPGG